MRSDNSRWPLNDDGYRDLATEAPSDTVAGGPVESAFTRLSHIPASWVWSSVGQLGEVTTGFTPPKQNPRYFGGSIPFFKPTDLDAGYSVRMFRESLTDEGAALGRLLPSGAVLVTCIGATIGKTGLARVACATNQQINAVVVPPNHLLPQWFYWWITSPAGQQQIRSNASATTLPILNKSRFEALPVPLAPFAEQHRIVAEIEQQFSRLDAGMAALKRVQANLKRYRAAVLHAACTGRLVPTEAELARAEGREYEPADQLLARILAGRRVLWDGKQAGKTGAKHTASKRTGRKPTYTEPLTADVADVPSVPPGWAIASMDQLTSHITSGSRDWSPYYGRGQGTFILAQNVRPGRLDLAEHQAVDPPRDDPSRVRGQVSKGDLLVTIVGANTGDVCLVPSELPEHFVCQSVALMRPVEIGLTRYLLIYMTSDQNGQRQYRRYMYGAGRPHLSFEQLKMTAVLLPPLAEQHRIVAEVERRLSIIDETEALVEANLKRAVRLRQAILKRAFEGKLVPQDPSDEPASVLLERISTERAAVAANGARKEPRRAGANRPVRQGALDLEV